MYVRLLNPFMSLLYFRAPPAPRRQNFRCWETPPIYSPRRTATGNKFYLKLYFINGILSDIKRGKFAYINCMVKRTRLKSAIPDDSSLRKSSVYREFLAEREEILKHKWLESEKAGHDIGYDRALIDWIMNHREKWRSAHRSMAK